MTPGAPALEPADSPFDQFQRYTVAQETARALAATGPPPRVLDVGGHHLDFWSRARRPIAEFLPELRTVTIDLADNDRPGYVRARGDAIPFAAGSMDLVVSVDVLEHVPPPARSTVVAEAQRVARRAVLLAAPFRTEAVVAAETLVSRFIREACGFEQGQLREHRELGWPDLLATSAAFEAEGWAVRAFGYGHVWHWALMMIDKHALVVLAGSRGVQTRLDRRYNLAEFATDTAPPWYRQFLVAARDPADPVLAWAEARFDARPAPAHVERAGGPADLQPRALRWLELHAANQAEQIRLEPQRRTAQVQEAEQHRAEVLRLLEHAQGEQRRLEALLREVEQSTAYRLSAWARHLLGRS
jgi:hypothetical protein